MENERYDILLEKKEKEHDAICKRCGACCGAGDDPCIHLEKQQDGKYSCAVYENRLGPHNTVSGKFFTCVLIRDHISWDTMKPGCAYRPKMRVELG